MFNILIFAQESKRVKDLYLHLAQAGYACSICSDEKEIAEQFADRAPDLVMLEDIGHSLLKELTQKLKQVNNLPVIALLSRERLPEAGGNLDLIDDFVIEPGDLGEVELRVRRLLYKVNKADSTTVIRCGALVIDLDRYEVSVGGKPVMLTFKEYELLKFLAGNKGHVLTRETLLNKVWGYDYFGGDRTVDVHITRLRSKIEDANHTFIETVRNVGYRLVAG